MVKKMIRILILIFFSNGPVSGFAITLSLGIVTSMFTAVFCTQSITYALYGRQKNSWIFLGFIWKKRKTLIS